MNRALAAALLALAMARCGPSLSEPSGVFSAYVNAFAEADSKTMWSLLSASARGENRRLRVALIRALSHADAAVRVHFQGMLGTTADELTRQTEPAFFEWAVGKILYRTRPKLAREYVQALTVVRSEPEGARLWIIYREPVGIEQRLPLVREGSDWRVDEGLVPPGALKELEEPLGPSKETAPSQ